MTDKFRYEHKYVCSAGQLQLIQNRLSVLLPLDKNAAGQGFYRIRSLYFDDYNNNCYFDNESGVDPREKFRIRIYNGNMDGIRLELKRKQRGKTQKLSCPLTLEQYHGLTAGSLADGNGRIEADSRQPELLNQLLILRKTRLMEPKVIVEYERVPYVGELGNVRITLDRKISGSADIMDFEKKRILTRPIMPSGQHLLEVKFDEFLPEYLYRAMQLGNLRQSAYSKYYLCRKYVTV